MSDPAELLERLADALNARDYDALATLFADDFVMRDRRVMPLWGEVRGPAAVVDSYRAAHSSLATSSVSLTVLGSAGDRVASHDHWEGVMSDELGGGPMQLDSFKLRRVEGGRFVAADEYATADEVLRALEGGDG